MSALDPKNELTFTSLLATISKTSNSNTTAVDISQYVGNVCVIVDVGVKTAGDNADSTYDIALYSGAESNGANAAALNVNATQATNTAVFEVLSFDQRACNKYLKAVMTIAGTNSPAFPVGLSLVGKKQVE